MLRRRQLGPAAHFSTAIQGRDMDLQLHGKHALITGGSKGIGLACAKGLLQEGARVTLVSRGQEHLDAARQELLRAFPASDSRIALYSADLKDATAAAAVIDQSEREHGPVDILVNSAGAAKRTPPDELTPRHWHDAMDAKYFTYIHMIDPLVKRMGARGAGVILNIVGMGGKAPSPTHMPGGAANAALMLVSAAMAAAYGSRGVRVNAVNPALTLTERMQEGLEAEARLSGTTADDVLKQANARMPLGRVATPEEIANAVLFLCSPRASYISGAILSMDGALSPMVV
jgi:NAD(P)-dependent dehydrogenase (short-subunit alcohol dehydrogenase family)